LAKKHRRWALSFIGLSRLLEGSDDPILGGDFKVIFLDLLLDLLRDLLLADNFRGSRDQEFYDAAPRPPDLLAFFAVLDPFWTPIF
jgi:hypothetical protein